MIKIGPKEILTLIVLACSIPLFIGLVSWAAKAGSMSTAENSEQAAGLITEAVTPWWLNPIVWLASGGTVGAIIIIVLLYFAAKYRML
ncbi:MAG: hypothetical protein ACP5OA_03115 [Candidatus Woesearchaeota archaeon]